MDQPIGNTIGVGSRNLQIVGIVHDSTALAGQPNIFLTVAGAQKLLFSGQQLISSIGLQGLPDRAPSGYLLVTRAAAISDLLRALNGARQAMTLMAGLLWVVAALIVGSMIYMSALERTRDFAVFKAVSADPLHPRRPGHAGRHRRGAGRGARQGRSRFCSGPLFPMRVDIPQVAFLLLPVVAITIGVLASLAGLRRAVTVDPALAFGGP